MRNCLKSVSKGFLKFCKLISNLILGQIIVSNLTIVHKLNTRINYARLHWIRYKKQTSNTIITLAYHSRGSSWKVSSKASIASDFATVLRIKQGEMHPSTIKITRMWTIATGVFLAWACALRLDKRLSIGIERSSLKYFSNTKFVYGKIVEVLVFTGTDIVTRLVQEFAFSQNLSALIIFNFW